MADTDIGTTLSYMQSRGLGTAPAGQSASHTTPVEAGGTARVISGPEQDIAGTARALPGVSEGTLRIEKLINDLMQPEPQPLKQTAWWKQPKSSEHRHRQ